MADLLRDMHFHLRPRHDVSSGFTESELAEMRIDPFEETPKYGRGVVYFVCGAIALFAISNQLYALRRKKRFAKAMGEGKISRRAAAIWRYLGSKQQKVAGWRFPVLGTGLVMLAFFCFLMVWTWGTKPYYRSRWNVGSPPLALRAGFMALGCFPFVMAFASKWNGITFITGCSHEKLQVYHQFMSHLFLVLSMIHAFPFVIQGMREIKPNTGGLTQLEWSWHVAHKVYYWSGTALLILLAWLCWASLPVFRRRHYEVFKWLHIISALLFTGFFFVHCNRLLGSWDYLYATVVIYGVSVLARVTYMVINNGGRIPRAHFEVLGGGMMKLKVISNPLEKWRPGQHYFLNFITCQPFQSHPFTIANIPRDSPDDDVPQEMVLLIRQGSGLTHKLRKYLSRSDTGKTVPVLLDGPYGGIKGDLAIYEHAVLIAGGTGITFILPVLQDLVQQMVCEEDTVCKSVELIWSIKTEDAIEWVRDDLLMLLDSAPKVSLLISIHVTKDAFPGKEDTESEKTYSDVLAPTFGRADAQNVIKQASTRNKSVGVAACGPESLVFDVRNAVADVQKEIVLGRTSCTEMFLHTEEYSW